MIKTELYRHMAPMDTLKFVWNSFYWLYEGEGLPIYKTVAQGASTSVTVASLSSDELKNGAYYKNCIVTEEEECGKHMEDAKALYDYCDEVTKKFQ